MNDLKNTLKVILYVTAAVIGGCAIFFMICPTLAFGLALHGGLPLIIVIYSFFLVCCVLFLLYKITTRILNYR